MIRPLRLALACAVLFSALSSPAFAQPTGDKQKALAFFDEGNKQYNLGRFAAAAEQFVKAYESYSAPEFLFNIAQAYRQDGQCAQALFFYKRYIANKPTATNKAEVEGLIKELDAQCGSGKTGTGTGTTGTGTTGTGTTGTGKTGTGTTGTGTTGTTGTGTTGTTGTGTTGTTGTGTTGTGTTGTTGTGTTGTTGTGTTGTGTTTKPTRVAGATGVEAGVTGGTDDTTGGSLQDDIAAEGAQPRLFTSNVSLGPSFLSAGDLNTPVLMGFAIGGGYPLPLGPIGLEPGALITYTPVPWKGDMDESGTAGLIGLLANAGATYPIRQVPKLNARGALGLGVLVMTGLKSAGNPFLEPNQAADGPITMFHMRLALGAEYAVTPNIFVNCDPIVLSFSPAGKLRDEVGALTRYEFMVGAGYKM